MRRLAPITAWPPAFLGPSGTCVGQNLVPGRSWIFFGLLGVAGRSAGPSAFPLYLLAPSLPICENVASLLSFLLQLAIPGC